MLSLLLSVLRQYTSPFRILGFFWVLFFCGFFFFLIKKKKEKGAVNLGHFLKLNTKGMSEAY